MSVIVSPVQNWWLFTYACPPPPNSSFPTQFTPSSVMTCLPKLTEGCLREWESRCESSGTRAAIKDVPNRWTEDCCYRYKRISQKWYQNVHSCFWSGATVCFTFVCTSCVKTQNKTKSSGINRDLGWSPPTTEPKIPHGPLCRSKQQAL